MPFTQNLAWSWICLFIAAALLTCLGARSASAQSPASPPPPAPSNVAISSGWMLQDIAKVSDPGEKISSPDFTPNSWNKATLPGTILTSLVNDGIYPEPLYGENNRNIPESLCHTSYWYRAQITVPQNYAGKHIWLNFEGINYTANVFVNGKSIGEIKGAFARGIFEITSAVKPGQTAAIAVKINPPPHPGTPHEKTVATGTGRNGGDLMQDGPTFGCTVGWDWIPTIHDRDMGIWQKVYLSATGDVRLDDPSISSEIPLPRTDSADLTLTATVRNTTDEIQEGMIHASYDGGTLQYSVILDPHETREVTIDKLDAPALHIENPKLWWPNTYGEPHLYPMHISFSINGVTSDSRDFKFGVRKITYSVPADQSTLFPIAKGQNLIPPTDNLTLSVNGVPIMCKGGCWGMDEAMKRIPADLLDAKVHFHQLANYNMIRNWVGQSTSEDFYNACDKYGILVWDEMFQANQSDGPPVNDVDLYLANCREKILRFRSHPSIALWCGRNESDPAPQAVADGLLKMTGELDPARFYQPNSGDGRGVRSGGPYSWRPPVAFFAAAGAPARGREFGGLGGFEPFKTELGSVSIPTLEAIKAMMPEKDLHDLNDDWAGHDLCSGAQQGDLFPNLMSQRYGPIAAGDLVDFTRKSQLAMYETYRAMYEGRMAKLFDPCSGVLTWMSNPAQLSFVWQIYSYDSEPLAALYGSKKGCEPLHIQMNAGDFHVMVINTAPIAAENLHARVAVYNMDGSKKSEKTVAASAKPCAATDLGAIEWPAGLSVVHFIKLELFDSNNKPLSDNFYWRTTAVAPAGAAPSGGVAFARGGPQNPPEDFSTMESMPTAQIAVTLTRHDAAGKILIDATLSNPTTIPAIQAHLQLKNARTHARLLPVFYSDNYMSLLPGENKSITIEAPAAQLGADTPEITVDGWNVTVAEKSFPAGGGISVTPNKDAFVAPRPSGVAP